MAGVWAEVIFTSRFATSREGLERRRQANLDLTARLAGFDAVLGFDGEGWLWARRRSCPYVAFCEAVLADVLPFENGDARATLEVQAAWEGEATRVADLAIARSTYAAGQVARHYGVGWPRLAALPVPFDVDAWRAALPDVPRELLVLSVGHAYPRKNQVRLLEAWPLVLRAHPQARLTIAGSGPQTALLEALARDMPSVNLAGHVPYRGLLELYARARVFCHPSFQENFGISVVEALASGSAVVTHRQAAVLETTVGLPGTWSTDASNPVKLADALIEALAGPSAWPAEQLDPLRDRLAPGSVGARLRRMLEQLIG